MCAKVSFLSLVAGLGLAGMAGAQVLTGSISAYTISSLTAGLATSDSLKLAATNFIESASGDFSGVVSPNSLLLAYGASINALSTTPLSDPLYRFFIFSSNDPFPGMTASGTTPSGRFEFELQTITEDSYSGNGIGDFSGTGMLSDNSGTYASSLADFTLDFTGAHDYSLTVETVPEPATMSLIAGGLAGLLVFRRRKI